VVNSNKRIVIILGMHRSGTSTIARGLQVLDVDLGDKLIRGIAGENDKGFWEDADINAFNEELLSKLDSTWHGNKVIEKAALLPPKLKTERVKAVTLLGQKIRDGFIFGFKDPRTAALLPFWQSVFKRLELDESYIITLRNPLSVADSLYRRNGFAKEKSCLLWVKHVINAVRYSKGKPRVVVEYDRLLDTPMKQLERISWTL